MWLNKAHFQAVHKLQTGLAAADPLVHFAFQRKEMERQAALTSFHYLTEEPTARRHRGNAYLFVSPSFVLDCTCLVGRQRRE